MPNRRRALRSIQLKRWNHWVRNVMRHHLNYVEWTQITGILLSTSLSPPPPPSPPIYLFLPSSSPSFPPCVLCAQSNDLWTGAKPTPAAAWLQLAANAKNQMQKVHNVWWKGGGRGWGRGKRWQRDNCGSVTGTRSPSAGSVWITIYVKLPI